MGGGNSPGKWVSVCDHFYGMFSCLGLGVEGGMGEPHRSRAAQR